MNEYLEDREAQDADEIRPGRSAPKFNQTPQWVALSSASSKAKEIHGVLTMHLNQRRGDRQAWPTKAFIAWMVKLKRSDKLDPYLKELSELGAVDVSKNPCRTGGFRNVYTVHETPPPGYKGPLELADVYHIWKLVPEAERPRGNSRRKSDTPKKGGRDTPKKGCSDTPKMGCELDVSQLHEKELDEEGSSFASVGSSEQVRNAREPQDGAPPARPGKPESSSGGPSRQAWDVFAALPPAWRKCPQWVRKLFAAEIDEALPKYGANRITAAVTRYAPEPGDLIGAGLTREDADKHLRAFRKVLSFAHSDLLAGDSPYEDTPGAVNTEQGGLPNWLALADDACAQCGKSTNDVTLCLELPIPTPLCAPHYNQTLAELAA